MKRALVTSGGGAKGAFSVGALQLLFQQGINDFDLISGTSTGALIAVFTALQDLDTLKEEYTTTTTPDILKPDNLVRILLTRNFIYDSLPLQNKIMARVTDSVAHQVMNLSTNIALTTVNLRTGRIVVFSTKPLNLVTDEFDQALISTPDLLRKAMLASSSQAAFLPPVQITVTINGQQTTDLYIDGGNREVLPTRVPVLMGHDQIFVLSNNPKEIFNENPANFNNILNILSRAISIFVQEIRASNARRLEDGSIKAIIIEPDTDLDVQFPTGLRFDQNLMINWMSLGKVKAEQALRKAGLFVSN